MNKRDRVKQLRLVALTITAIGGLVLNQRAQADLSSKHEDKCSIYYGDGDYCVTPKGRVYHKTMGCRTGGAFSLVGILGKDYTFLHPGFCGYLQIPPGYEIYQFKQSSDGRQLIEYGCSASSGYTNQCSSETWKKTYPLYSPDSMKQQSNAPKKSLCDRGVNAVIEGAKNVRVVMQKDSNQRFLLYRKVGSKCNYLGFDFDNNNLIASDKPEWYSFAKPLLYTSSNYMRKRSFKWRCEGVEMVVEHCENFKCGRTNRMSNWLALGKDMVWSSEKC